VKHPTNLEGREDDDNDGGEQEPWQAGKEEENGEDTDSPPLIDPGPMVLSAILVMDAIIGMVMGILTLWSPRLLFEKERIAIMTTVEQQMIKLVAYHVSSSMGGETRSSSSGKGAEISRS